MPTPKQKFLVDETGKKTAVLLDINEYQNLLEAHKPDEKPRKQNPKKSVSKPSSDPLQKIFGSFDLGIKGWPDQHDEYLVQSIKNKPHSR